MLSLSLTILPAVPAFAQYNETEQSLLQDLIEFAQILKEQKETAAVQLKILEDISEDLPEDVSETTKEINEATGRAPGISAIAVEEEKHDIEKANELTSFVGGINGVLSYMIDEVAPSDKETLIEQLEDRKPSEEPAKEEEAEIEETVYDKADYVSAAYSTSNSIAPTPYLNFFEADAGERFSTNEIKPDIKQTITFEEAKQLPSVVQLEIKIRAAEDNVLASNNSKQQTKKAMGRLLDILEPNRPKFVRREVAPSEISIQPRNPITAAQDSLKNESLYRFFNDAEFSFLRDEQPELYYGKAFDVVQRKLDTVDNPENHLQLMNAIQHVPNEAQATAAETETDEEAAPKTDDDALSQRQPRRVERFIANDIDKRQTQILGEILNIAAVLDANMIIGLMNNNQSEQALAQLKAVNEKLRTNITALSLMRMQGDRALILRLQDRNLSDADRIAVLEVLAERMDEDIYAPSERDLNIIKQAIRQFKEKVKRELGQERIESAICEYQAIIEQHTGVVSTLANNTRNIRFALANEDGKDYGFAIQMANMRQILLDRLERIIEAAKDRNDPISLQIIEECAICSEQLEQLTGE